MSMILQKLMGVKNPQNSVYLQGVSPQTAIYKSLNMQIWVIGHVTFFIFHYHIIINFHFIRNYGNINHILCSKFKMRLYIKYKMSKFINESKNVSKQKALILSIKCDF